MRQILLYFAVLFNYSDFLDIKKSVYLVWVSFCILFYCFINSANTFGRFLLQRVSLIKNSINLLKLNVNILYYIMDNFLTSLYAYMQVTSLSGAGDISKSSTRGMYLNSLNFRNNCCFFRELC